MLTFKEYHILYPITIINTTINKELKLYGSGNTTFDAHKKGRIFYINASDVVLEDLILKNGYIGGHGAAVYWYGNDGLVNNCIFINNNATRDGGAISTDNNQNGLVITNCSFDNCYSGRYGGAIAAHGYNFNIINNTICIYKTNK